MSDTTLFWSKKGEVACAEHAPARASERWTTEAWQTAPQGGRLRYQCQHCAEGPVKRTTRKRSGRVPLVPLVLNVDDRPAALYTRDRILRLHGFSVANADTAYSALHAARELRPQVILLDVQLPDLDGRELCQRIKADEELKGIPVVLISATVRGHANQLEAVRWGGADGFLAEPVEAESLVSTLWKVIESEKNQRLRLR